MKKTALELLIEDLDKKIEIVSEKDDLGTVISTTLNVVKSKATELLEYEREEIQEAYHIGMFNIVNSRPDGMFKNPTDYFNNRYGDENKEYETIPS